MPAFEYTAIDPNGQTRTGRLKGANERSVRTAAERRGLLITQVSQVHAGAASRQSARSLSGKALALISRQLATLVMVAPVEESLRTLAAQAENRTIRAALGSAHENVVAGLRLSEAMAKSGGFPATFTSMIAAGESAGALPEILDRMADLLEKQQDVRAKVTSALVYPIVLAVVATIVIIALMTFVVPKVVDQFNTSGQELPALTQAIIAISSFMVAWGWLVGIVGGLAVLMFGWSMTIRPARLAIDRFMLKLPVIGRLLRDVAAAHFARNLGTMLAARMPAVEALSLAAETTDNSVFANAIRKMTAAIGEGASLSSAMRQADVFPPLLVYLTSNGENGGQLDAMLQRAADYLEREFRTATTIALSLLEPAIIILMGGIVCLVILSILLPILQINTLSF